ncbi:MAG TPA: hypothetical protein VIS95_09570 [Solirubrobacterales bacterium]
MTAFGEIVRNFREERWGPAELNGGKLAEISYTVLRGHVDGVYPAGPEKPRNMVDACRRLEQAPAEFPRSVRIQIPRMLLALYEIRNNRGVGHVGGDVDPNQMDAIGVLYMAKWIVAEMVRIFHGLDTMAASQIVEALVEREVPLIWEVDGRKRILGTGLSRIDMTLALLYGTPNAVSDQELANWIEHPKIAYFRRDVLRPAHKARLIEFDESTSLVHLSPLGARRVEEGDFLTVD